MSSNIAALAIQRAIRQNTRAGRAIGTAVRHARPHGVGNIFAPPPRRSAALAIGRTVTRARRRRRNDVNFDNPFSGRRGHARRRAAKAIARATQRQLARDQKKAREAELRETRALLRQLGQNQERGTRAARAIGAVTGTKAPDFTAEDRKVQRALEKVLSGKGSTDQRWSALRYLEHHGVPTSRSKMHAEAGKPAVDVGKILGDAVSALVEGSDRGGAEAAAKDIGKVVGALAIGNESHRTPLSGGLGAGPVQSQGVPGEIKKGLVSGVSAGLGAAGDVLTAPQRAVETAIAKGLVTAGLIHGKAAERIKKAKNPLEAALSGYDDSKIVHGADITEGVGLGRQLGLLADLATDPLMYVGVAGLPASGGTSGALVSARIAERLEQAGVADHVLNTRRIRALEETARRTGDETKLAEHLRKIAKHHNVSLRGIPKAARRMGGGQSARAERTKEIFDQLRAARAGAPSLSDGTHTHVPGGEAVSAMATIAGHAAERGLRPGARLRVMLPTGHEITHVPVPLPGRLPAPMLSTGARRTRAAGRIAAHRRDKELAALAKDEHEAILAVHRARREAGPGADADVFKRQIDDIRKDYQVLRAELPDRVPTVRNPRRLDDVVREMNERRLQREVGPMSESVERVVRDRFLNLAQRSMKGLNARSRERVFLAMHHESDVGALSAPFKTAITLTPKEEKAKKNLELTMQSLAQHGKAVGTLGRTVDYYAPRIWRDPARDQESVIEQMVLGAGQYTQARSFSAAAELQDPNLLAAHIRRLSDNAVTPSQARAIAEDWHQRSILRTAQELVARRLQRGEDVRYEDLTQLERGAVRAGMAQKPPLFAMREPEEGMGDHVFLTDEGRAFHDLRDEDWTQDEVLQSVRQDSDRIDDILAQDIRTQPAADFRAMNERLAEDYDDPGYAMPDDVQQLGRLRDQRQEGADLVLDPIEAMHYRVGAEARNTALRGRVSALAAVRGRRVEEATGPYVLEDGTKGMRSDLRIAAVDQEGKPTTYTDTATGHSFDADELPSDNLVPAAHDNTVFYDPQSGERFIHLAEMQHHDFIAQAIARHAGKGTLLPQRVYDGLRDEMMRLRNPALQKWVDAAIPQLWAKINEITKFAVTQYFPAYHMRNVFSDVIKSMQADSGVIFHPLMIARAWKTMFVKRSGKMGITIPHYGHVAPDDYMLMADVFGLTSGFNLAEFTHFAKSGQLDPSLLRKSVGVLGPRGGVGKRWLAVSARREDTIRTITFLQRMRRNGGDAADAAWYMIRHHFDYHDLSANERRFARNLFLFYTWYRKNIPLQLTEMIARPGFFSGIAATYRDLGEGETPLNQDWSALAPWLPDMNGKAPIEAVLPEYMEKLNPLRMKWNDSAVEIGFGAPWSDINLFSQEGADQAFSMTAPLISAAYEAVSGKDSYIGRDFKAYETSGSAEAVDWLSKTLGLGKLRRNKLGQPVLPAAWNIALQSVPFSSRALDVLRDPSPFQSDLGFMTSPAARPLTGLTVFAGPSKGKKRNKAIENMVKGRQGEQTAYRMSLSGRAGLQPEEVKRLMERFDDETLEWAKERHIPLSALGKLEGSRFYRHKPRKRRGSGDGTGGFGGTGSGGDGTGGFGGTSSGGDGTGGF